MAMVSGTFPLPGSERPRPDHHKHIGPVDPDKVIGVTVMVRPRPGSTPPPDLVAWRATPPRQKRAISREEYAKRHGADPADLEAVTSYARSHGLHVAERHGGRRSIVLEGKPAQFEAAFGVKLQEYEAPVPKGGRRPGIAVAASAEPPQTYRHHGHDGPIMLPAALNGIVVGIVGFDNRIRAVRAGAGAPAAGTEDPPGAQFYPVPTLAQQYNFPTSGAADQTIGVFAPTSPLPNYYAAYWSNDILNSYFPSLPSGWQTLPTIHDVDLIVGGTKYQNNQAAVQALQNTNSSNAATYIFSNQNGGIIELTQDISTSSTIAQGATINVYFNDGSEQGWLIFLNRVLLPEGEQGPSVVTISFTFNLGDDANGTSNYNGIGQLSQTGSIVSLMTAALQALASVGVNVFIALGDWGADNWWLLGNNPPIAPDGASHVMYPGSDPWVTSCGGTVLGTSEEVVWGFPYTSSAQSAFGSSNSNRAATGGGVSKTFIAPTDAPYQTAAGITGATDSSGTFQTGRGVPDVAGMVALTGFFANGLGYGFIGTSCVAPLYAGLCAVIKSAIGEDLGPWNDTLYALQDVAFNPITTGGTNSSGDTPANVAIAFAAATPPQSYTGTTPNAPYFTAGSGWNACTGLGSIDGTELLNGITSLLYNPNWYFQLNKGSFGLDEVDITQTYSSPTPLWLVLEGFTPNQVKNAALAPSVVTTLPGLTVTPQAASPQIPSQPDMVQRILYPCTVQFTPTAAQTVSQGGIFPSPGDPPTPTVAPLISTVSIGGQILTAESELLLDPGADPYFANFANNEVFYLSDDLRVFTVTPGANNTPIDNIALNPTDFVNWDSAAAYAYIQALLAHLNATYTDPNGTDAFSKFPDQTNALSGDSSVTPTSPNPANATGTPFANYNFAVARVRLDGAANSSSGANVRVLFRLFAAQTSDTDFQSATYPSNPNDPEGQPLEPVLGVGNVTIPFFATGNYEANSDYQQQTDYSGNSINNQPVSIGASGQTLGYYGCYLNIYPTANTITTSTGKQAVQSLLPSTHSCIVAQLVYDDAPYPSNIQQGPEFTPNFAQRNLQITFSDNPGAAASHVCPQTFDLRPGPAPGNGELEDYPDELMIDWGETPPGSLATIYWPAVAASDVLTLAQKLYSVHTLTAADANTIKYVTQRGFTFVPIPSGSGENFAGLFTVNLPYGAGGVKAGQNFTITVRRLSTRRVPAPPPPPPPPPPIQGRPQRRTPAGASAAAAEAVARPTKVTRNWRYIVGTFAVRIPVTTASTMLSLEENTLAIMKWRLDQMAPDNRWYPVLLRYINLIAARLNALGGSASSVEPSPYGVLPSQVVAKEKRLEHTGKVAGLIYDRFGDFGGFCLLTECGEERQYRSRESEIEALLRYAWRDRVVITVLSEPDAERCPVSIILQRAPPQP
jgi:hypothetical protein